MAYDEARQITWCVSHDNARDTLGDRVFSALGDAAKDLCREHFPESAGYETTTRQLSGPVEGETFVITRRDFQVLLSLQRYGRRGGSEIRLVAVADFCASRALARQERASEPTWNFASLAAGGLGLGLLGLTLGGALTTWSQVVLLIPALTIWRIIAAIRIANNLRRSSPEALKEQQSAIESLANSPACRSDRERWQRLRRALAGQRESVAAGFVARPFRSESGISPRLDGTAHKRPRLLDPRARLPATQAAIPIG